MRKYHIKNDGTPGVCRAKEGNCPLGDSSLHFDNFSEAAIYADMKNEENFFTVNNRHEEIYNDKLIDGKNYSMMEAIERGHWVEEQTSLALANKEDSYHQFYDKETDLWSEEREELHYRLLSHFEEKYRDVPSDGMVIISGGLPGAGKTTCLTTSMGVDLSSYATVSSDDFKEMLASEGAVPEIEGLTPMESSTLVHQESSYLADKLMSKMARENKNVIYDCTCRDLSVTKGRVKSLINSGYSSSNIQFVFVDIPIDTAHERAKYRYRDGLNNFELGGRYLPAKVIDGCSPLSGDWFTSRNAETVVSLFNDEEFDFKTPIIYNNKGSSPVEILYSDFEGDDR